MLKDISNALISADVNVALVVKLRENIKQKINAQEQAVGLNKKKVIQKVNLSCPFFIFVSILKSLFFFFFSFLDRVR